MINDDDDDECKTRAAVWRNEMRSGEWRVVAGGWQEVPPTSWLLEVDFFWVRGGSVVPPFWLLWQGAGRVAGGVVDTTQRIYIQGAVGEVFHPAWRSPGGLEECRHHGEGRAELCGANNKRDTTPEGWLFLKLLDV